VLLFSRAGVVAHEYLFTNSAVKRKSTPTVKQKSRECGLHCLGTRIFLCAIDAFDFMFNINIYYKSQS